MPSEEALLLCAVGRSESAARSDAVAHPNNQAVSVAATTNLISFDIILIADTPCHDMRKRGC